MAELVDLDLSSLNAVIGQLEKFHALAGRLSYDPDVAEGMRMAAIQALEFNYELSIKMLRRFLSLSEPTPDVARDATFQSLIRLGCSRGVLQQELAQWMRFRQLRGTTSHAYDAQKALEVIAGIPKFLTEAKYLRDQLAMRIAAA